MNRKRIVILVGTIIGICLLTFCLVSIIIVTNTQGIYYSFLETTSLQVGSSAPDFELQDINNEIIRLSDYKGKPIILTIGASWCVDCIKEAPLLQAFHETHPEITIIMVDVKESKEEIVKFRNKFRITYCIAMDPNGLVYNQYRIFAIPTLLFIDENGIIKARIIERVNEETLNELLREVNIIK